MIRSILFKLLPTKKKETFRENVNGGLIQDPPDERDFVATSIVNDLPTFYSLVDKGLSRVETQGSYNSCVAHAITTAIEMHAKNKNWPGSFELSRMHVWNEGRKLSGTYPNNEGMFIRDGWKAVQKNGVTIEKLFPYYSSNFNKPIGLMAEIFRRWYPSFTYYAIGGTTFNEKIEQIKQVLHSSNVPVVFGCPVSNDFISFSGDAVYKPDVTRASVFHHAMVIVGWDDARKAFLIQNSWGKQWAHNGRAWIDSNWLVRNGYSFSYAM